MIPRLAPIAFALAALLAPPAAAAQSAATAPGIEEALPELELKPAPRLVPPPGQSAGAAVRRQPAASAAVPAVAPSDGAIFLRADRIEGTAEQFVEASGKVELRTRRETVLADWLRYDIVSDEIWGKGDVLIRHGTDWITGPEVRFKRGTETGFFTSPRFFVGENGSRGSAAEIRFSGPDHYDATDARYTTCVAPREDWYLRMGELEVDKTRMVGTGRDATVYFFGAPVIYSPWFEFPLSNERKSGFLTPTTGLTGIRGFEYSQPYYLNLAPNYDATITPRLMTKRGVQIGGQGRYLFADAQGEAAAEYLHNDRVTGTDRYALSSRHTQNLDFLPGLVGYWNLNKVSDNTYFADLSDRVGLTSQTTLPREGGFGYSNGPWQILARAQGFQTLQDPTAPQPIPYNRVPQALVTLQELDWSGLTFAGVGEYAYFRQPTLTTGQRVYAWPTVAWERQGAAWSVTARTGVHARQYDLNEKRPDVPSNFGYAIPISSVDGGLVFERDWDIAGQRVHPDARAARLLRLRPLSRPEQGSDIRHRGRRLQLRPAVQRQPLSRQRPDRRRQPAHARADVAPARNGNRRRTAAGRRRPALLLPGPEGRAERVAALGRHVRCARSASRAVCPTRGRSSGCGNTTWMRRRPSA